MFSFSRLSQMLLQSLKPKTVIENAGISFKNILNQAKGEQVEQVIELYKEISKYMPSDLEEKTEFLEELSKVLVSQTANSDLEKYFDIFKDMFEHEKIKNNPDISSIYYKFVSKIAQRFNEHREELRKNGTNLCQIVLQDDINQWDSITKILATSDFEQIEKFMFPRIHESLSSMSEIDIINFLQKVQEKLALKKPVHANVLLTLIKIISYIPGSKVPFNLTDFIGLIVKMLVDNNIKIPMEDLINLAKISKMEDLRKTLNPNLPQYSTILTQIEEIQGRKLLALACSIEGNSTIQDASFELTGSKNHTLPLSFLQRVAASMDTPNSHEELSSATIQELTLNQQTAIIKAAHEKILSLSGNEAIPQSFQEQITLKFISSDVDDGKHAISFGFMGNMFCYVNRGYGNHFSGIRVFELKNPGVLAKIKELSESGNIVDNIEDFLDDLKPIKKISMQEQKTGNCAFVACKTMYWFAVYFETLKYLKNTHIKNKEEIARNFALQAYKNFSIQARIYALNSYLKIDTELGKDLQLLTAVCGKLNNKQSKLNKPVTDFVENIDPYMTKEFTHIATIMLEKIINAKDFTHRSELEIKQIYAFIKIFQLSISEAQKEDFYFKILNRLVTETDLLKLYQNTLPLFTLLQGITPQNFKFLDEKKLTASAEFIKHVTAPHNMRLNDLIKLLPATIQEQIKNQPNLPRVLF